ncbi:MAG: hypothetical protein K0R55_1823 [Sporomusa sp.]|nr:hypothetical protein [Sporomusa sp.]
MFWYLSIVITVSIGMGVLIGLWLILLEDEQGSKKAGSYAILVGLLVVITAVFSYRFFLIR